MIKRSVSLTLAILFLMLHGPFVIAAEKQKPGNDALVTYVEGTARMFLRDKQAGRVLKKGDRLGKEHEVRVGEKSRIEITFPDRTVMRLSEKSRLVMSEMQFDKKTESKKVKVGLGGGKLWAKVKKLATPDSSVEVKTGNAVAGVRGTVYRVNVEDDKSAMVKVYDGSVYVANSPKDENEKQPAAYSAPVPVPGPHEVPPPAHEVSLEEWHVIVKAMQRITISSQGVPSKPEDFDAKADTDDWVKWNQERDKQVSF